MSALRTFIINLFYKRVLENVCRTQYSRRCLLRYIAKPFLPVPGFRSWIRQRTDHQNLWQVLDMAEIISQQGFVVDVVDYSYADVHYRYSYDLVIDIHPQFPLPYQSYLKPNARKIAYITGPNPELANQAEKKRLIELKKRQQVTMRPQRYKKPFSPKLNTFEAIFSIGNQTTLQQFKHFNRPQKFSIPNTGYDFLLPTPLNQKKSHAFLFLGSSGQVFRGLDLVLETFEQLPECHLYVCGPFEQEIEFCQLYHRQLFETPNIHPVGFIDVKSSKFKELCQKCSYFLFPTCAEGQSGSVLTAMSAGVIPITTKESGVDGLHYLQRIDIPYLKKQVQQYVKKSPSWIQSEAKRMKQLIRKNHAQVTFQHQFKSALTHVLRQRPKKSTKHTERK